MKIEDSKMNHRLFFLLAVLILSIGFISAQDIKLEGAQLSRSVHEDGNRLQCKPVKLTHPMKIVAVEGKNAGFWLEKESQTILRFEEMEKSLGVQLQPGTYYIYPYLEHGQKRADIKLVLRPVNGTPKAADDSEK